MHDRLIDMCTASYTVQDLCPGHCWCVTVILEELLLMRWDCYLT